MNITIIGPGAIGTLLASTLSKAGATITIIAKPEHQKLIERSTINLINNNLSQEYKINIKTKIGETDYIILTTKSYDVLPIINSLKKTNIPLMCCQNGLQTMYHLKEKFGNKRVAYLVTGYGLSKVEPGTTKQKGKGFTFTGNLSGEHDSNITQIANYLVKGGMECKLVNNIQDYIWLKAIINSSINPIAASEKIKNGYLQKPEFNKLLKQICLESTEVATKLGVTLPLDPWKEINNIIKKTFENECSMLQDIKNKKQTEIEAINGEIVKLGKTNNVKVPLNQKFLEKIKLISNQYQEPC